MLAVAHARCCLYGRRCCCPCRRKSVCRSTRQQNLTAATAVAATAGLPPPLPPSLRHAIAKPPPLPSQVSLPQHVAHASAPRCAWSPTTFDSSKTSNSTAARLSQPPIATGSLRLPPPPAAASDNGHRCPPTLLPSPLTRLEAQPRPLRLHELALQRPVLLWCAPLRSLLSLAPRQGTHAKQSTEAKCKPACVLT